MKKNGGLCLKENDKSFTPELLERMEYFFSNEISLLSSLNDFNEDKIVSTYPLIYSLIDTSKSMIVLGKHNLINDLYMVSRAYIERLVNFLYLQVCDEEEFTRFMLHTTQKAYRRLDRSIKTEKGSVQISFQGKEFIKLPNLEKAIDVFTSKSGKEITNWTPISLDKRIEFISNKTSVKPDIMLLCKLNIYEDASEALHGTLYGSSFHLGIFSPNTRLDSPEDLFNHFISLKTTIFWTIGILTFEMFEIINKLYEKDDLYQISKKYYLEARETMMEFMKVNQDGSNIS